MNVHRIFVTLARGSSASAQRAGRAFWDDVPPKERCARLVAAAVVCWVAGGIVLAERRILWLVLVGWCVAAWRTGRSIERQEAAEAEFVQWIRDRIGDRNGVLVAELLAGLHAARMHQDWDAATLRQVVERLGIPVRDSLKVGGTVSTGVHVDDLTTAWDVHPTPPPPDSGNPSPTGVTSDNYPTTPRVEESASGAQITVYPAPKEVSQA